MNSFNSFFNIKRKLVKCFFIIYLGFNLSNPLSGNPIIPPSMITEIYFGQWSWEIELHKNDYYEIENLDSLWLYGQYDTAKFEYGHEFYGNTMVVTNYDMLTSMYIDQSGDYVCLYYKDGEYGYYLGWINWGTFAEDPRWGVTAPVGEQSIALQNFNLPDDERTDWTVKEQPHTIGSSPWHVTKRANFSGYVRDINDQPLPGIMVDYCYMEFLYHDSDPTVPHVITDSSGYFFSDDMYCRKYYITFKLGEYFEPIIGDTNINIEPDSANYFEFKLDTLLTGIKENKPSTLQYSIFNIPNPSSSQTKFIIKTSNPKPDQKGVIKIYSEAGYIVDIVPVEINNESQDLIYNFNDKTLPSGLYFYSLETRNQKVASGKMIISR
jgi:hypothetical protein